MKDYDIQLLTDVINYNHLRYYCYKNSLPFELNSYYEKILKARYSKSSRIQRRFFYLLTRYSYIWFCTFTFDNNYINKSTRTKRDLIKNVINSYDFKYILNVDYGKSTEREHYHCLIGTNYDMDLDEYIKNNYPCFSKSIECKKGIDDFKSLSKYIDKLTNHCIKATTKRQRIVYNFKGYDDFCPTAHDVTVTFKLEKYRLFDE